MLIERKIRHDGSIVEVKGTLSSYTDERLDMLHYIDTPFTVEGVTITQGHYTKASYWFKRPYNVYRWFDAQHNFIAAYFNIVGTTTYQANILSFEDKIIDVLVLPNGQKLILDENELPVPLAEFENGTVAQALARTLKDCDTIVFSPALVFDLDGTICFNGQPVAPSITDALYALYCDGYDIIIASARPIRDIYPVLPSWMHQLPMVGGNGAFIKRGANVEVVGFDCATALTDIIAHHQLTYLADSDWDYAYTGLETHPIFKNIDAGQLANRHSSWKTLPSLAKLVIFSTEVEIIQQLQQLPVTLTIHAGEALIDISPNGCTKWAGLQKLGLLPKQFIAFGNDSNDCSMFEQAAKCICIGQNPDALRLADVQLEPSAIASYLQSRSFL